MKTMRNSSFLLLTIALIYSMVLFSGCKSWSRAEKGAAIGAGAGAAAGAAIGHQSGNTAVGAIIGAAVGGAAGGLIGTYMDKQAEEIKNDVKGAKVERIGEGIKITFDSGILFAVNSHDLNENSKENIRQLAQTLKKYEDTNILIEGHTDSTGEEAYNQTLSERRANSVSNYLKSNGVTGSRITTVGYGENQPIASNETEAGRSQNRRVEVAIFANEKLKRAAERGDI
jgi:outer membrane protein OmpA-like peptidoglycan-associated protein